MKTENETDGIKWWQWLLIGVLTLCCLLPNGQAADTNVTGFNSSPGWIYFDSPELSWTARSAPGETNPRDELSGPNPAAAVTFNVYYCDPDTFATGALLGSVTQTVGEGGAYSVTWDGATLVAVETRPPTSSEVVHIFGRDITVPAWAVSEEARVFFDGFAAGALLRLFRAALRWFKRVGRDLGYSGPE